MILSKKRIELKKIWQLDEFFNIFTTRILLILLVKNMLSGKLHYQKGFNPIPFPYKIDRSHAAEEVRDA